MASALYGAPASPTPSASQLLATGTRQQGARWWQHLRSAAGHWSKVDAAGKSAAIAYYTLFALVPLLLLAFTLLGQVQQGERIGESVLLQVQVTLGHVAGNALAEFINDSRRPGQGLLTFLFSLVIVAWGSLSLVSYVRSSLNAIFEAPADLAPRSRWRSLGRMLVGLGTVCGGGLLLLVANLLSSVLAYLQRYWPAWLGSTGALWTTAAPHLVTFALTTALIALLFRALPDVRLAARDIWAGSLSTAVLFTLGRVLLSLYLERSATSSSYGAASSLVVLLIWFYYTSQILFFGACLTHVRSRERQPAPDQGAES